jgi:nitroreductase
VKDLFEVIKHQRAYRTFAGDPVSDDDLARVLEAATFAPSAENRQPWEFIVVRDATARVEIGALMRRAWEAGGRAHSERRLAPGMLADVDAGMTGGFERAPVHIVVCADVQRGSEATVGSSIFPAVQNLLLTASALGLGTALTTIATAFRSELQTQLALPDYVWPVAVVPIGHPVRKLGPPRRDPFAAHTHRERYNTPW